MVATCSYTFWCDYSGYSLRTLAGIGGTPVHKFPLGMDWCFNVYHLRGASRKSKGPSTLNPCSNLPFLFPSCCWALVHPISLTVRYGTLRENGYCRLLTWFLWGSDCDASISVLMGLSKPCIFLLADLSVSGRAGDGELHHGEHVRCPPIIRWLEIWGFRAQMRSDFYIFPLCTTIMTEICHRNKKRGRTKKWPINWISSWFSNRTFHHRPPNRQGIAAPKVRGYGCHRNGSELRTQHDFSIGSWAMAIYGCLCHPVIRENVRGPDFEYSQTQGGFVLWLKHYI